MVTPPNTRQAFGRGSFTIIGSSNGHEWIKYYQLVCCANCGTVRRGDDLNKECKGPTKITLREQP